MIHTNILFTILFRVVSSLCSIITDLNFMLGSFQKQMVTFEITVAKQAKLHYKTPYFLLAVVSF